MADIAPLTPLRYQGPLARVVAPPYDVIDAAARAELAARDPHNVVRLILPEGDGDSKYANAATLLAAWRSEGVLVRDEAPAFYRYDQRFTEPGGGRSRTRRGFLALVKLVPFSSQIVLPHERTLSGPKEDRLKLFRATRTNLSPGFMLYRDPGRALDAPLADAETIAELSTPDGVEHTLAKVGRKDALRAIAEGIARSSLLIADGHHRYETALRYAGEIDAAHAPTSAAPEAAEHKWFMVFLANGDDPDLVVFPTHRHVHSLARFQYAEMIARAGTLFSSQRLADGVDAAAILESLRVAGQRAPTVAACGTKGEVTLLSLLPEAPLSKHPALGPLPDVLRRTDVALLHGGLLEGVLGVTPEAQAAKTNLWYPQDASAALARVRSGASDSGDVLFLMNATPVRDVRAVAEAGHVMPQKSTFFYPKVLTGLAIHTLEPSRRVALL
jgi:uncharacterized protein (DUF1015 family)